VAIQATRAATTCILFNSTVTKAVEGLHNNSGDFVHPNQNLLLNQPLCKVQGEVIIALPSLKLVPVPPCYSPIAEDGDEYLERREYAYYSPTSTPPTGQSTPSSFTIAVSLPLTLAIPLTLRMPSPDPLPLYEQNKVLLPPPSLLVTAVNLPGPQPRVIPGPDWHPNIVHQILIPNGNGAITMALFLWVNLNDGMPRVKATMGLRCSIMSQLL